MPDVQPSIETLLRHRGFVRNLAGRLLRGDDGVDDVVQETWFAALRRPRAEGWPLASWLGGLTRNLSRRVRRDRDRRELRERATARPELLRPTAEIVAEEETRASVVAAVLALEEPCRTAILLRYYDGLPPRAIASRLGLPGATVRSHLHRGLERLRARLDADHGDRRTWAAALVPLAGGESMAFLPGVLLMSAMSKNVVLAALLLVAASITGAWLLWPEPGASPPLPREAAAAPSAPVAAAPASARAPVPATVAAPTEPMAPVVRIVAAEDQAPLPGAAIEVAAADGRAAQGVADAAGRFAPPWHGRATLWASAPERRARRLDDVELGREPVTVALARGPATQVRFVTGNGQPIGGAEAKRQYEAAGVPAHAQIVADEVLGAGGAAALLRVLLGPAAAFCRTVELAWTPEGAALPGLAAGSWRLFLERPAAIPYLADAVAVTDAAAATFTVPLPSGPVRRVRLLEAATGAPLGHATVTPFTELGDDQAFFAGVPRTADAYGELSLPVATLVRRGMRPPTWRVTTPTHAEKFNLRDGSDVLEVRVPQRGEITGRAWRRDGTPAEGCEVVHWDKGLVLRAKVAADGAFTLPGVPAQDHAMVVLLEGPAVDVRIEHVAVSAGKAAEVVFGQPSAGARITGRITVAGRGVRDVSVVARSAGRVANSGAGGRLRVLMSTTDAEGRYKLESLTADSFHLQAYLGDLRVCDDFRITSAEAVVLQQDEARVLDFDLPAGALRVQCVDAATGAPIAGAVLMARPSRDGVQEDRFAGFSYRAGWAGRADKQGRALLPCLPQGELHVVEVQADGYAAAKSEATPGIGTDLAELVVRLQRKP